MGSKAKQRSWKSVTSGFVVVPISRMIISSVVIIKKNTSSSTSASYQTCILSKLFLCARTHMIKLRVLQTTPFLWGNFFSWVTQLTSFLLTFVFTNPQYFFNWWEVSSIRWTSWSLWRLFNVRAAWISSRISFKAGKCLEAECIAWTRGSNTSLFIPHTFTSSLLSFVSGSRSGPPSRRRALIDGILSHSVPTPLMEHEATGSAFPFLFRFAMFPVWFELETAVVSRKLCHPHQEMVIFSEPVSLWPREPGPDVDFQPRHPKKPWQCAREEMSNLYVLRELLIKNKRYICWAVTYVDLWVHVCTSVHVS